MYIQYNRITCVDLEYKFFLDIWNAVVYAYPYCMLNHSHICATVYATSSIAVGSRTILVICMALQS